MHAGPRNPDWIKLVRETPAVQTEWAARYEHGEGVTQDFARAMRLYCAAARRGHVAAQYQLGWMYANGRGVARDDVRRGLVSPGGGARRRAGPADAGSGG